MLRFKSEKILRFYDEIVDYVRWLKEPSDMIFPSRIKPKTFHLFPSQQCNFNCSHCGYFSIQSLPRVKSFVSAKFLFNEVASIKPLSIHYSGYGEPTTYPHLLQLIEKVKSCFSVSISQFISSNGSGSLDIYRSVDSVRISLDAAEVKTHSKVHGCSQALSRKVFKTVDSLLSDKGSTEEVSLAFLITPDNFGEVFKFVERYSGAADFLQIRPAYGVEYSRDEIKFIKSLEFNEENVLFSTSSWDYWLNQIPQRCLVTPFNVVGYNSKKGFRYCLCQDKLVPSFQPPFVSWWGKARHRRILREYAKQPFCTIKCPFSAYNELVGSILDHGFDLGMEII